MGLLDKALVLDDVDIKEERSSGFFSPDIQRIMNTLSSTTSGIDFPSTLFAQIKNEFEITKGALLLPEENLHFVPWAETGFDRTTSRRIRIPQTIIEKIHVNNSYKLIELSKSEIEVMSDYFSFREFSVTESVLIAPLYSEKQLVAIVFISQGSIMSESRENKIKLFSALSDKAGPLLFNKRESILNKMEEFGHDDTKEKIIDGFIGELKDSGFLLLSIQLSSFIQYIMDNGANSISFRIKQDILRLIKTLVSNKGEVINSENNSVILLLKAGRIEEAELFIHQIGLSLCFFYKITTDNYKPEYTILKYPDDGGTASELLQTLSKNEYLSI